MKYVESNIIVLDNGETIGNIYFSYDVENDRLIGMKYTTESEEMKKYNKFEILKLAIVQNEYLNAKESTSFDKDIYFDVQDMETIKNIMNNNYSNLFSNNKARK